MDALGKAGIKFYKPTAAEHKLGRRGRRAAPRVERHQEGARRVDRQTFDKLKKAANTKGKFTVDDYKG